MPKGKRTTDRRNKQEERSIRSALKKERKAGAYLNPGDPDFKSFATQLSIQGLALKDVAGDGNCLFRALSDQLHDGHSNHLAIRRAVVRYMRENREHFAPFMEEDFNDYITSLARDGEYAGNDAIVAFSRCYGVHVVIHQLNEPRFEVHAPSASNTTRTVHIAYLNGEHYCSVQPLPHAKSAALPTPLLQVTRDTGKGEGNAPTSKRKGTTSLVESTSLSPAEKVVVATGCEDMELVEQCLRENSYDSELAVVEVLQLMSLGNDDIPPAPTRHLLSAAHLHMPAALTTSAQDPPSTSGGRVSTAMKPSSLMEPLTAESASSSLKPTKPTQPQYHQRHLSNRERKEQAKAARKQRKTQERKGGKAKQTPASALDPVGATTI